MGLKVLQPVCKGLSDGGGLRNRGGEGLFLRHPGLDNL